MKILLTGHKGFIGGHMLRKLLSLGHEVTTHEWGDPYPQVSGHDWCIHIGANSSTVERDVEKILSQNLDFSVQLYNDCMSCKVKFQYSSSASVYGLVSTFCEDAPLDPRNPYAWTKYLFERYVQRHPSSTVAQGFRYFNVYGPEGEEHKGTQASPFCQFKQQAESTGEIKLFEGSEHFRRDFVHVSQVVDTHIKFFDVKESGVWNLGTGNTKSFKEVAETFNAKIVEVPMPDVLKSNYQEYTCADCTKLNTTLSIAGWRNGNSRVS